MHFPAPIPWLRRAVLMSAVCAVMAPAQAQCSAAPAAAAAATAVVERDGNGPSIPELYQATLEEGGTLTVYAGGDEVTQGLGIEAGFERACPRMKIASVGDLSKFHDARIEEEMLREDAAPLPGVKTLDQYKTNPKDLLTFMSDRARVERLKSLMERLIDPVQGISPLKD